MVEELAKLGLPNHASPLLRPWNLFVAVDAQKLMAIFSPSQGGMPSVNWLDLTTQLEDPLQLAQQIQGKLGWPNATLVTLPWTESPPGTPSAEIRSAAKKHAADVERAASLGKLGDLSGFEYLEPYLRTFLEDHPNPVRNVFIMMRYIDTDPMEQIHRTIKDVLTERGFHGVRADDRDYTGELWTNVEVMMMGCAFGIAVFEDIEEREFNPNVALELGFLLARRKRCLILKEKRLPILPTDIIGKLYKPFDMFDIGATVRSQVLQWIDVDLGLAGPTR